jgi:large subunit ribosomal protein L31e
VSETAYERIYTVPLGRARMVPRYRRAEKAVTILRKFVQRHMKPEEMVIDTAVNEAIWARGITNPPRKIRVRLSKDDEGLVTVSLAEAEP